MDLREQAAIYHGIAHGTRLRILGILQEHRSLTMGELGDKLAAIGRPVRGRNLHHHVHMMAACGIVELSRVQWQYRVTLLLTIDVEVFDVVGLDDG